MAASNLTLSTLVLCVNGEHPAKPRVFLPNPVETRHDDHPATPKKPKNGQTQRPELLTPLVETGHRTLKRARSHRGVFSQKDPAKIAASLKRSAERSKRRKADPYRSALSMLTFYINRAGKNLPASRKKTLNAAKDKLREKFGKA